MLPFLGRRNQIYYLHVALGEFNQQQAVFMYSIDFLLRIHNLIVSFHSLSIITIRDNIIQQR